MKAFMGLSVRVFKDLLKGFIGLSIRVFCSLFWWLNIRALVLYCHNIHISQLVWLSRSGVLVLSSSPCKGLNKYTRAYFSCLPDAWCSKYVVMWLQARLSALCWLRVCFIHFTSFECPWMRSKGLSSYIHVYLRSIPCVYVRRTGYTRLIRLASAFSLCVCFEIVPENPFEVVTLFYL